MSAPSRSHRLAISLMKLIFVASMALAAYLVISADSGDMTRNGRSVRRNGAYSSRSTSADLRPAHADDDAVGLHEVVDRRPFLEELGVAGHVDRVRHRSPPCRSATRAVGADRHRALDDDDLRPVDRLRRSGVGRRPRRADRSAAPSSPCGVPTAMKIELRRRDAVGQVGGERQPALAAVALDQLQQARLVDRDAAAVEQRAILPRPCRRRPRRCRSRRSRCR